MSYHWLKFLFYIYIFFKRRKRFKNLYYFGPSISSIYIVEGSELANWLDRGNIVENYFVSHFGNDNFLWSPHTILWTVEKIRDTHNYSQWLFYCYFLVLFWKQHPLAPNYSFFLIPLILENFWHCQSLLASECMGPLYCPAINVNFPTQISLLLVY